MNQELIKHGFSRRLSASELALSIVDEIVNTATSNKEALSRRLVDVYEGLIRERPFSAVALNILRVVSKHILESSLDNIDIVAGKLREEYLWALGKSVETASKRFENGDIVMVNTNGMGIRKLLELLRSRGVNVSIYVAESRPGLEGLLLAEYAESLGFNVFLIVDSAMRFFMKDVDKVVIGAEAVLPDGSVVGKVGTSVLAFVAKEFNKEVLSITPAHKFYYELLEGEIPVIPEKNWDVLMNNEVRAALPPAYNARVPLYDITPPRYIDYLATEHGLISPYMVQAHLKDQVAGLAKLPPLKDLILEIKRRWGL